MTGRREVPHNTSAEQALLGAMLLSPDARREALNLLDASDFYTPAHQHIFHAVATMFENGEVVDPVTVCDHLTSAGLMDAVGGPAVLVSLQRECPAISNAARYAKLVLEASVKRRVITELTAAADVAFDPSSDADDVMESVKARFAEIRSGVADEIPAGLWTVDQFLERDDAVRPPWVVPGMLRVGWRALVIASEGLGKATPVSTKVATPSGWTTMGDLSPGDTVFDMRGDQCRVDWCSPVDLAPESYRVVFSDGVEQVACADHQWVTVDYQSRQPHRRGDGPPVTWPSKVVTTREMAATLHARDGAVINHAIPVNGALQMPDAVLPVAPYTLGVWLGDGETSGSGVALNDDDAEAILAGLRADGECPRVRPSTVHTEERCKVFGLVDTDLRWRLKSVGVFGDKHIPAAYLRASESQREALLRGLMDTDGYCAAVPDGGRGGGAAFCELTFTCQPLAEGTVELIRSLGMAARITESEARLNGRYVSQRWRIQFQPDRQVFTAPRKAERVKLPLRTWRSKLRYVTAVEPVAPVPMRCIAVDSPDNTYLCGEHMVPTHNSVLFRQLAIATAQGIHPMLHTRIPKQVSLIVDLENPDEAIIDVCTPIVSEARRVGGEGYEQERAWLWHRPGGINLRARGDRAQLEAVIATVRPSLVCIGPLYKCYQVGGHESDEQAAGEVERVFDDLRTRYQFALMIEHHAPKKTSMSGKRDLNPYGSSLWLRWPELGITLEPIDGDVRNIRLGRFRGDRVVSSWPESLERSKPWPWRGVYPDDELRSGVHSAGPSNDDVF